MTDTHFSGVDTPNLKKAGVSISLTAEQINALVQGAAAGYKLARGSQSVTGWVDVDTGLDDVVAVVATLKSDPSLTAYWVSAEVSITQGYITLRVWMPTSSTDVTPLEATSAAEVYWVAIGT